MTNTTKNFLAAALLAVCAHAAQAQSFIARSIHDIKFGVELQSTVSGKETPLWLTANRHGLTSVRGNNGYWRRSVWRDAAADSTRNWRLGYGLDMAAAYNFPSKVAVQQLYADLEYKRVRLSVGAKEQPMMLKNNALSSGSQTLGINARPIPQARIELPDYISLTGKSNLIGIKGHFGYGLLTDGRWQKKYVDEGALRADHVLYHSKAGYVRVGNDEKFPLTFEGGVEMATMFGGTVYNITGRGDAAEHVKRKMPAGFKDFVKAIYSGGSDPTDGDYLNAAGNTVGSWVMRLNARAGDWRFAVYYDHFFEDHSMMFFEYGWQDGMIGAEIGFPKNPVATNFVYEYINTTYQSGPVYHDGNDVVGDQISAVDNYYNHNIYPGWQHHGQAIGNPLFASPLYCGEGTLAFTGNRFKAHHFGLAGNPVRDLSYRLLFSYQSNWGRYSHPYPDVRYDSSFLGEVCYAPSRSRFFKGWSFKAAYAFDDGALLGNNHAVQFTIARTGTFIR